MWHKPVYTFSYNLCLLRLIYWDMLMPLWYYGWYGIHLGHSDSPTLFGCKISVNLLSRTLLYKLQHLSLHANYVTTISNNYRGNHMRELQSISNWSDQAKVTGAISPHSQVSPCLHVTWPHSSTPPPSPLLPHPNCRIEVTVKLVRPLRIWSISLFMCYASCCV